MTSSPTEPSEAQWRVINAALEEFALHGIGGTSLRMIARKLGVTVAAVYHQYNTKAEIVFAAVESQLRLLEAVVDDAESAPSATDARDALVGGMVDLAIGGVGRSLSAVLSDPLVTGSFGDHAGFRELIPRIRRLLVGGDESNAPRIRTATLIAAINGAAIHPFLADLDEQAKRDELLRMADLLLPALEDGGPGSKRTGRG